jgi:hypothetical protein
MKRMASWCMVALLGACGSGSSAGIDGGAPDGGGAGCTAPTTVPCTDESVLKLVLYTAPSTRTITNSTDGTDFVSEIDATGGGSSPRESYVYARFTAQGLERVDVGDEAAFSSMAWDIAFRRFVIRLNSGVSGPSCVSAAKAPEGTSYAAVTAVPADAQLRPEDYFDAMCDYRADWFGLMSPVTRLSGFWKYDACVQMTGAVYYLSLADGRRIKATVEDYYSPAVQDTCDSTGMVSMGAPTGSGRIRLRWAPLP